MLLAPDAACVKCFASVLLSPNIENHEQCIGWQGEGFRLSGYTMILKWKGRNAMMLSTKSGYTVIHTTKTEIQYAI